VNKEQLLEKLRKDLAFAAPELWMMHVERRIEEYVHDSPKEFYHIDWCTSSGPFGALDCSCPETPREELLLRKFDGVVLELESLKKNDPPYSREKLGVIGPDGHAGAYAVADHILRLIRKPVKVEDERWEPSPFGRLSRGTKEGQQEIAQGPTPPSDPTPPPSDRLEGGG